MIITRDVAVEGVLWTGCITETMLECRSLSVVMYIGSTTRPGPIIVIRDCIIQSEWGRKHLCGIKTTL